MEVKRRSPQSGPRPFDRLRPAPPVAVSFPPTFPVMVERGAQLFGDKVFLGRRHPRGGGNVSFNELQSDVRAAAAGLVARGVQHGDKIAIMSENRYQWLLVDLAATYIGAIDVPRGADTAPTEMAFILEHSGCEMVFVENDRLATEMMALRQRIPVLHTVCSLLDKTDVEGVITLPELLECGREWIDTHPSALDALSDRVSPNDILTIVYTSGTTAEPKGVMLTHGNVLSNVRTTNQVLNFDKSDKFLSVLPPWHMYERMMDYVALAFGAEIVFTDRRRVKEDLQQVQPTLFAAVPRIWEALHDGIIHKVRKLPNRKRKLMCGVIDICRRVGAGKPTLRDRLLYPLLRATLLKKFQTVTGGRLRIAVSGGGALPAHVDETLIGLGIPLCNGYGLTETSPVAAVRAPYDNRSGTLGPPLPETVVEIRDQAGTALPQGATGLIWIHGPGVMRGYYNNPDRTSEVLRDGWFNSGDLGSIEPDGHVRITGRAKDTIVLAGGENIEPEYLETAIRKSPLIAQAVLVGQDQKALGALLVVDTDALEVEIPRTEWAIDDTTITGQPVVALLRRELGTLLSRDCGFRNVERVTRFHVLLQPMTPENGLLTQTMKVKRHIVDEHYADLIGSLFS